VRNSGRTFIPVSRNIYTRASIPSNISRISKYKREREREREVYGETRWRDNGRDIVPPKGKSTVIKRERPATVQLSFARSCRVMYARAYYRLSLTNWSIADQREIGKRETTLIARSAINIAHSCRVASRRFSLSLSLPPPSPPPPSLSE